MNQARTFDPELPFLAHPLAVDFANSTGPPADAAGTDVARGDLLRDPAGLRRWLEAEAHAVLDIGPLPVSGQVDLGLLRELRNAITELLRDAVRGASPSMGAMTTLNAASAAAPIHPELVGPGTPRSRLVSHARDWQSELVGRIARSTIGLLTSGDRDRLGVCAAPACGLLFLASRRGQRWCADSCGNRARVARHYRARHHGAHGGRRPVRLPRAGLPAADR